MESSTVSFWEMGRNVCYNITLLAKSYICQQSVSEVSEARYGEMGEALG